MMFDVVVIAAGLGGLSTAQRLRGHGLSVVVLEAQNHIGGVCRSELVDGFLCDSGLHLVSGKRLSRLLAVDSLDLRTVPEGVVARVPGEGVHVLGGVQADLEAARKARIAVDAELSATATAGPYLAEWFNGVIEPDQPWGVTVKKMWESSSVAPSWISEPNKMGTEAFKRDVVDTFYSALTWDRLGLASFNRTNQAADEWLLHASVAANGVGVLSGLLAQDIEIHLNVKATSVVGGDRAIVHTNCGTYQASAVVLAAGRATRQLVTVPSVGPESSAVSLWFAAEARPTDSCRVQLGFPGVGRVLHSTVVSNLAPSRAPSGSLVEATVLRDNSPSEGVDLQRVLADLSEIYSVPTRQWGMLRRYDLSRVVRCSFPGIVTGQHLPLANHLFPLMAPPGHANAIEAGFALADSVRRYLRRQGRWAWIHRAR